MRNFFFFILLLWVNTVLSINPIKDYISKPSKYNIDFTEFVVSNNNVNLNVWHSKPKVQSKRAVILAYGDYGNMSYYLNYIKFYTDLGFHVISFDYRGFGGSSSFEIKQNYLYYSEFAEDLENVIKHIKDKCNFSKLGVVSLSMGSIISSLTLPNLNLDFLVSEGSIYDLDLVISRIEIKKSKEMKLPDEKINLTEKWKKIKCKILLLSASNDYVTTFEDSKKIMIQDSSKRLIYQYEGAHLTLLNQKHNVNDFKSALLEFLSIDG